MAPDLPFGFREVAAAGVLRQRLEDFIVEEIPSVEPSGQGEHQLLWIEKRNSNTDWVAGQLARFANVPRKDVSYAGLKDRQAITRQWFSVRLAGKPEPDWQALGTDEFAVQRSERHNRKLKIGALKGNRFIITIRSFVGDVGALSATLERVSTVGMPNYFGEQRFGSDYSNLDQAKLLFSGELGKVPRPKKSLYLSAARSHLFNLVLAERVRRGDWNRPLPGERLILDGSRSSFLIDEVDETILQRIEQQDIHTSGPLWGAGDPKVTGDVAEIEQEILKDQELFKRGLVKFGLKQERRALRAPVKELDWSVDGDALRLSFALPKGCYATALLRECLDYSVSA